MNLDNRIRSLTEYERGTLDAILRYKELRALQSENPKYTYVPGVNLERRESQALTLLIDIEMIRLSNRIRDGLRIAANERQP